jgi:hypothetical protein
MPIPYSSISHLYAIEMELLLRATREVSGSAQEDIFFQALARTYSSWRTRVRAAVTFPSDEYAEELFSSLIVKKIRDNELYMFRVNSLPALLH